MVRTRPNDDEHSQCVDCCAHANGVLSQERRSGQWPRTPASKVLVQTKMGVRIPTEAPKTRPIHDKHCGNNNHGHGSPTLGKKKKHLAPDWIVLHQKVSERVIAKPSAAVNADRPGVPISWPFPTQCCIYTISCLVMFRNQMFLDTFSLMVVGCQDFADRAAQKTIGKKQLFPTVRLGWASPIPLLGCPSRGCIITILIGLTFCSLGNASLAPTSRTSEFECSKVLI
ncbi:uncharacterized protein BO88DRAFT_149365 [Aspergillus vadensis CBS 113365]|uniref:Uncharacterized protein n=1 Tax=Aspergillus vadensis (strain CBS 113365 / IMI 142717 / IBT 24658) TaxID=1448311 RepID=A0A319BGI0_ASPVC|nr:hypothetical protein BO88DRAFT_149365 [Aspergillus vadensis CBS 113365]PYH64973.1 hypothetical protein BO88DRAFT_149365 [Aspergillus vadensis CBS 113365]